MPIDENGVHSSVRLNVGDTTSIHTSLFPNNIQVGARYISPIDSDHWILKPDDGGDTYPCVVLVDDVVGDYVQCVVVETYRD